MNKRGISAIVASVFIIFMVVFSVFLLWEVVFSISRDGLVGIADVGDAEIVASDGYTNWNEETGYMNVQVRRNNRDREPVAIDFIFSINGSTVSERIYDVLEVNSARVYAFNLSNYSRPDEVSVAFVYGKGVGNVVSTRDIRSSSGGGGSGGGGGGSSESKSVGFLSCVAADGCMECDDGLDNDNDGLVDLEDAGCIDEFDASESLGADGYQGFSLEQLEQPFMDYSDSRYAGGVFSDSLFSDVYYSEPYLAALISMYQATQNVTYLEYALNNVEIYLDDMIDLDGDGYKVWPGPWDHDKDVDTPSRIYCLSVQRGFRQFIRLARIIKNDVKLNKFYGARADSIILSTKHDVVNDPYCRERFRPGYNTVHTVMSHPVAILLELYLIEGNVSYLDGEDITYLDTLTSLALSMKNSLFVNVDDSRAIVWGATWCSDLNYSDFCYLTRESPYLTYCRDSLGAAYCSVRDVSHSENYVAMVLELYRAGVVFTRQDVDDLVYTFTNVIWDGNISSPKFYDYVDGNLELPIGSVVPNGTVDASGVYGQYKLGGNIAPGWVGLGAFSNEIQRIMELRNNTEPYPHRLANNPLAYYAELARNLVVKDCRYTNTAREIADGLDNDCDGLVDEGLWR